MKKFDAPDLQHVPLSILHYEESFVVVDKLPDFLSVPGRHIKDCVVNRIRDLFPQAEGSLAAHRLDMETSGLMLLGLTPESHRKLSLQFEQRLVHKTYTGLVEGVIEAEEGHIELAFRVDIDNRPMQILDPEHGKLGITDWKIIERYDTHTRLQFTPTTGRTHQLRVHAAHPKGLGHPLIGDSLYGNPAENRSRLMLHSTSLAFHHPVTDEKVKFELPAPF